MVRCTCPGWKRLPENHFDIVNASGVIGYAQDPWDTIETLLRLVKTNGYFLDLEMDESIFGKLMSALYNYPLMRLSSITQLVERKGFNVKLIPLGFKYFPVNLTRIAIFAEKT
jgi:ubiquinone/menaquinone biosynthesis C-methylase UbiE